MAAGDSLFVQNDGAVGLSAQEARLALMAQWATNSANPLDVRTGLVFDGRTQLLTGTGGLSVNVAAFHFVANKGGLNGIYQGCNNSTTAVTVPAAPSLGNKRTDLIWVEQQDKNAVVDADASTQVVFGVVTGTPTAGTPSKPALPAGTAEVGTVTWDSSSTVATATNAAQCTLTTTGVWTVARGAAIPVRNTTERAALSPYVGMQCLRLDKPGLVQCYDGSTWRGQRRHTGTATVSTDGSGFATVTHGAGFTPAHVLVQFARDTGTLYPNVVVGSSGNMTSTTFRVRFLDVNESTAGTANLTGLPISYECVEAES